ncbi:hypothetical protein FRUB_09217 [Fimbriiglobus ruber]|uniref:Uncharacterized protein n=1 Tax=Fimbriiglobus ruber TaxID=1908690 RepID=A0A225DAG3_9BACT|nr:hypothetical protein FRUB_09217 [Fimbriiglobus ruber]
MTRRPSVRTEGRFALRFVMFHPRPAIVCTTGANRDRILPSEIVLKNIYY